MPAQDDQRLEELYETAEALSQKMSLQDANDIFTISMQFAEQTHPVLASIFSPLKIPESCLPYPKGITAAAMLIMAKRFLAYGKKEESDKTQELLWFWLDEYVFDEEAIDALRNHLNSDYCKKDPSLDLRGWQHGRIQQGYPLNNSSGFLFKFDVLRCRGIRQELKKHGAKK